jgi:hypothetical protein
MQRASIHKYLKPRAWVTRTASANVAGREDISIPEDILFNVCFVVLRISPPSPQQWLRVTYGLEKPREVDSRCIESVYVPTSSNLEGIKSVIDMRQLSCDVRHSSNQEVAASMRAREPVESESTRYFSSSGFSLFSGTLWMR